MHAHEYVKFDNYVLLLLKLFITFSLCALVRHISSSTPLAAFGPASEVPVAFPRADPAGVQSLWFVWRSNTTADQEDPNVAERGVVLRQHGG